MLATTIGAIMLPKNIPLVQEEFQEFTPARKVFINAFSGFNLKFLANPKQKLLGLQNGRAKPVKEQTTGICDTAPNTAKFSIPANIEQDASYTRWGTNWRACDLQPLVDAQIIPPTTINEFNRGILDSYAAMYFYERGADQLSEQGWQKMQNYAFGHQSTTDADLVNIARMPGTEPVNLQVMRGYIPQIALKMYDAGRTINTNFSASPLGANDTRDEMNAMIVRQGIRETVVTAMNSGYAFHMTHACAQNYGDTLLSLGLNTTLLQAQTIDGSVYRVDAFRNIVIIVHPEWDEVLIAEGKEPNLILLAPMQSVTLFAPDPRLAPEGLFPYVLTQEFAGNSILDKKFEQLYEWWGGALVGGLAEEYELSF